MGRTREGVGRKEEAAAAAAFPKSGMIGQAQAQRASSTFSSFSAADFQLIMCANMPEIE